MRPPRVAVADGATLAFFAREWAWLVAEHFCRPQSEDGGGLAPVLLEGRDAPWREALDGVRQEWQRTVWESIQGSANRELLENRFHQRDAGVTTLVGLEMDPAGGLWRVVLIGDSCLLSFSRSGEFRGSVPFDRPEQFSNRPEALISIPDSPRETEPWVLEPQHLRTDEVLVLATDALAKWLLALPEGQRFTAVLALLSTDDGEFDARVAAVRSGAGSDQPVMEDDDVTLVVVAFGEPLEGTVPLPQLADVLPPLSVQALGMEEPEQAARDAESPAPHTGAPVMFDRPRGPPTPPPAPAEEPALAAAAVTETAAAAGRLPQNPLFTPPSAPVPVPAPQHGVPPSVAPSPPAKPPSAPEEPELHPDAGGRKEGQTLAGDEQTLVAGAGDTEDREGGGRDAPLTGGGTAADPGNGGGNRTPATGSTYPRFVHGSGNPVVSGEIAPGPSVSAWTGGTLVHATTPVPAQRLDLIGQLAKLGERRLAILALAGWLQFLVTAVGVGVMWPRSADDSPEPAKGGSSGSRTDSARRTTSAPRRTEAAVPVVDTLGTGTLLFPGPRDDTLPRFVVRSPVAATVTAPSSPGWRHVEFNAWVASRSGSTELASRSDASVIIYQVMNARAEPDPRETLLGRVMGPTSFPYRDAGENNPSGWYPVRISGFVRDPR